MFKGNEDLLYEPQNLFIWFLLAFQGGCLNTGGYLAVHRFVSHMTGFATLAGVAGAKADWSGMLVMIFIPSCFLGGVIISAWNVERQRIKNQIPRYSFVFSLIIFNNLLVAFAGTRGYFGEFGETAMLGRSTILLMILAFTCGLQNAVISSASGMKVRTTHLTGPTTDFGIGLVRIWTNRNSPNHLETFANWCRFGTYFSFIFGSLVSALLYNHFKFYGFYLPVIISLFTAIRLQDFHKKHM
jgi:uncharacterized membrane protein YoaK (UPF0700 family)